MPCCDKAQTTHERKAKAVQFESQTQNTFGTNRTCALLPAVTMHKQLLQGRQMPTT